MDNTEEDPWLALNITRTSVTRNTLLGKRRACNVVEKYEWSFLSIVSFTLAIVLAITLYRIAELPSTSSDFTLAILVLINICFCYAYAYHGVFFEQPHEIYFLVLSTGIIMVYSVLSYNIGEVQDSLKAGKFIYTSFVGPIIVVMGFDIGCGYKKSGNLVFRTVGGDPFMQSICRRAQLQCVLLLFDAQAISSCIVLIIHAVGINILQELLVLILGSVFIVVWMLIGYFMASIINAVVRFENFVCAGVFLTLCTVQPSYVVWRLVISGLYQSDTLELTIINVSGIFFLYIHVYLVYNTIRVYRNFGKGLKEKIFGGQQPTTQYGAVDEVVPT